MLMATLEIKSLYDDEVYAAFLARLEKLTPESTPQWGKMNVAQMLAHCSEVQEVMNGKPLEIPWFMKLLGGFIKKMVTNTKPYTKNMQTAPQYVVVDDRDFETEKARFISTLEKFRELKDNPPAHTLFGVMSENERGWSMFKHHDHHLQQFGV